MLKPRIRAVWSRMAKRNSANSDFSGCLKRVKTDDFETPVVTDLSNIGFYQKAKKQEVGDLARRIKAKQHHGDPFPGDAPIPMDKVRKYKRGHKMDTTEVSTKFHREKHAGRENLVQAASRQAARTEALMPEQAGYLEAEEGEHTSTISQYDIAKVTDITSTSKFFELSLPQFGPYHLDYTRNGRFLLIGGGKGHIAAFDWMTKNLMCEVNVMETVTAVTWLHIETMFAVAQKQWTYVYDNQGIELHCLKQLDSVLSLQFLPYHFLLASGNAKGFLSWLDVSVGQKVAGYTTGLGRLDVMCHNPRTAILHCGHSGGTVTLWSPNVKEPLVKMLCHGAGTRAVAVDQSGSYMATSGIDRKLKIWDLRTYKCLQNYSTSAGAGQLVWSQRGLLAAAMGNVVEVFRDCVRQPACEVYMSHRSPGSVRGLKFCPYEDVLGVGHQQGFSSLIIPGAGEPNFDALEANPYQSKKQRQHAEVSMLLDKVHPSLISLDTSALCSVDTKTLEETMEEKKNLLYLKPTTVNFTPKHKKKGRSKAGNVEKRKKAVRNAAQLEDVKQFNKKQKDAIKKGELSTPSDEKPVVYDVFDRFKNRSK